MEYATCSAIHSPCIVVACDTAAISAGPHPVEVEKVIYCPQSVTEIGSGPNPERAVEQMAVDIRVKKVEQPRPS